MSGARVVKGEIPAEEFALSETLQSNPDARLESERIVQGSLPLTGKILVGGADPTVEGGFPGHGGVLSTTPGYVLKLPHFLPVW